MLGEYTFYLFGRPSFWEGAGRVFDFGNSLNVYNVSPSPGDADHIATVSDWAAIASDIRAAIEKNRVEKKSKPGKKKSAVGT